MADERVRAQDAVPRGTPDLRAQNILIVDDEPDSCEFVSACLSAEGYNCATANTAQEALDLVRDRDFDLAVLDVHLGETTGLDLLPKIREYRSDIAAVVVTGADDRATAIRALELGAQSYVIKPFEPNEVIVNVASALEHRRLVLQSRLRQAELEEAANTDQLTGLLNRRSFDFHVQRECNRAERYGRSLCLLFIDVDDFKQYNDLYGHKEGDVVLARLGAVLQEHLRASDTAFRFGGEEFVALLPETGNAGAIRCAERVRELFANTEFRPERGNGAGKDAVHKTVSIGAVRYEAALGPEEFVRRADEAMYRAKRRGKDQTVFFE